MPAAWRVNFKLFYFILDIIMLLMMHAINAR